jgi:hypothetical protein
MRRPKFNFPAVYSVAFPVCGVSPKGAFLALLASLFAYVVWDLLWWIMNPSEPHTSIEPARREPRIVLDGRKVTIDLPDGGGIAEVAGYVVKNDKGFGVVAREQYDFTAADLLAAQPVPSCLSEEELPKKLLGEIEHQRRCVSFAESSAIHAGAVGNQAGEKEAWLSAAIHKVTAESLEALLPKGTK